MREESVTITASLADFWRIWRGRGTDAPEGGALRGPTTLVVDGEAPTAPPRAPPAPAIRRRPAPRDRRAARVSYARGSGRDGGALGRALRHVEIGDRALGRLGGEADRLRQGRMRMDGEADVLGVGAHLERV